MQKNLELNDHAGLVLIATCGMNCGICVAHLRSKNVCPGCSIKDPSKSKTRSDCSLSNCILLNAKGSDFCYGCGEYPCKRLKHLDKRYRTKYHMSMIENLENIKKLGIHHFVQNEQERWRCPECGGVICVHKGYCLACNAAGNAN
jgi:hypothetical protein